MAVDVRTAVVAVAMVVATVVVMVREGAEGVMKGKVVEVAVEMAVQVMVETFGRETRAWISQSRAHQSEEGGGAEQSEPVCGQLGEKEVRQSVRVIRSDAQDTRRQ